MLQSNVAHPQLNMPERMSPATLAMCPPDHFDVTYQINPWMDLGSWSAQADKWHAQAMEEWLSLKALYERLGHTVHTIAPQPGLPDMVFMANCAAVLDGKALLARFRHPERQGEQPHYQDFFGGLKETGHIESAEALPEGLVFEGCGDALWDTKRRLFWMGHSQRTSAACAQYVANAFDVDVVPLELVSPRFYHLDVALAPLSGGEVVYIPEAFSAAGRAQIKRIVGADKMIAASPHDAEMFAVNLVNLNKDIVLSGASDALTQRLEGAGYRLHTVPTQAFQLGGGSVFCLTHRLDHSRE